LLGSSHVWKKISLIRKYHRWRDTDLRERSVIPNVSVVGEAVPHVAKTTTLDILLDRIEKLFLGNLHLRIGPSWDFHDHVQYVLAWLDKEGDVVEGRHNISIRFNEDTVIWWMDEIRRRSRRNL